MRKKILALLMSAIMLSNTARVYGAGESNAVEKATWDGKTTESVYEAEGYAVTMEVTSHWKGGYNANIEIKNTSDINIENWYLNFEYASAISNIWDAAIYESDNGKYIIKYQEYNQDIPVGKSVKFGISGKNDFEGFPDEYKLVMGEYEEEDETSYSVEYVMDSDWGTGFTGRINITNNSDVSLEDWKLEMDFARNITGMWGAKITSNKEGHYVVDNGGYNRNIKAGETITIGFSGMNGTAYDVPNGCVLSTAKYLVEEDVENPEQVAKEDAENDNVADYIEDYFGTDKTKSDTDDDGLTDEIEIYTTNTDPTLSDTDGDGKSDIEEDFDEDELTSAVELELGTDIIDADTDGDGLTDGKEVNVLGSDPLKSDSDQDGVADGVEYELGYDLLYSEETFEITEESVEEDTVKASVNIELSGEQVESLSVEKYEDEFLFPETMPGYIGGVYDFTVDGEFEEATLSFEFDSKLLNNPDFDPVIYYFNEKTQLLEPLKTTVNGNIATAVTTHFSKYVLINRKIYEDSFEWQDVWTTGGFTDVEIVLVIDDSGSMTSNDKSNKRLAVAKDLVENLPENSKMGIVKFTSTTTVLTKSLLEDKEAAKAYLTSTYFKSSGNTNMYGGIDAGMKLFQSKEDTTLRMMIVLSDGITSDTNKHSAIVKAANENGIKIYTVGLGNSSNYFNNYLKPLANNTAGQFYYASNASELKAIYDEISKRIDVETDSDEDGIPDYYEENMVMFSGVKITLDKNNPDTDGDGKLDGEEIVELNYEYNSDKTQVIVRGKLISNPLAVDSDYDGKPDDFDASPMSNKFEGELDTEFANSDVSFSMDYRWFFENNKEYNEDLSVISSLFASAIYHPNSLSINNNIENDFEDGKTLPEVLRYFGFKEAKCVELKDIYNDKHMSEVGLGYRTVKYGDKVKNVIAVVVRGTDSSIEEWSSNFEIGNIGASSTNSWWKTKDNHEGFDIAANRIMKEIKKYVVEYGLDTRDYAYWVTGHSRGAAIANIIGAYFEGAEETAFTYTYAAPNTTMVENASSYKTIFNVINSDDFVPCLPMDAWGYTRYGKTADASIDKKYEGSWEELTGIWDYNPDTFGMDDTVKKLGKIIHSGDDARVEAYNYTCDCHGDGTWDEITIINRGMSKKSREKAIDKIPSNALPYCEITKYNGFLCVGWNFECCQTPAYFMQILASKMAGKISNYRFVVELNVADRYESAKTAIISSALGGLEHPHYTESYYLLANKLSASDF